MAPRKTKKTKASIDASVLASAALNVAEKLGNENKRKPLPTGLAGKPAEKRQRSVGEEAFEISDGEVESEYAEYDNEECMATAEDPKAVEKQKIFDFKRTLLLGKKNTQMRSRGRAQNPGGEARRVMCRRCAGEVSQFPDLKCITDPASTAGKCYDCKKKNKSCDDVPDRALSFLDNLVHVAADFTANLATREELDIAQEEFNMSLRQIRHTAKKSDEANAKAPWKPVVESNESTSNAVVLEVRQLNSDMDLNFEKIANNLNTLIDIVNEDAEDAKIARSREAASRSELLKVLSRIQENLNKTVTEDEPEDVSPLVNNQ